MIDWIAGGIEMTGGWLVGNKNWRGFLLNAICCVLWIVYVFVKQHTYGLLLVVVPMLFINIRNLIKWVRDDGKRHRHTAYHDDDPWTIW